MWKLNAYQSDPEKLSDILAYATAAPVNELMTYVNLFEAGICIATAGLEFSSSTMSHKILRQVLEPLQHDCRMYSLVQRKLQELFTHTLVYSAFFFFPF